MAYQDMTIAELRAEAKKWKVSGGGSQADLAERLTTHVDTVRNALEQMDQADLERVSASAGVATDPGQGRFERVEALLLNGVDLDELLPDASPPDTGDEKVTPPGTVWMGGRFHVDVGSAEHEELKRQGFVETEAPKHADPIRPDSDK